MRALFTTGLIAFALPIAAMAKDVCTFTSECMEGEACAETSYAAEVAPAQDGTFSFTTDAETLTGQMVAAGDTAHFLFEGSSAAHFVTRYTDGAARYTVHMDGPFTITYHGMCEEAS